MEMFNDMDLRARPADWRFIELCAGSGGLGLALKLAVPGARCVAYVERDAGAAALLAARMEAGDLAPAPIWSDLATFDGRPFRGRVHCVASGDPCQPNSVAGKRAGADDDRFLIEHVARIVAEVGPPSFFRENVTGNADGQIAALIPLLEAMGRRIAGGIWSAKGSGNSHNRERLFILAELDELVSSGLADADGIGSAAWPDVAGDAQRGWANGGAAGSSDLLGHASRGDVARAGERALHHNEARAGQSRRSVDGVADAGHGQLSVSGRRSEGRAGSRPAGANVADAVGDDDRGAHLARDVRPAAGIAEGEARIEDGQRRGAGSSDDRENMADADDPRLQGDELERARDDEQHWRDAHGSVAELRRAWRPLRAPAPNDPLWADVLDANPLLAPAIGNLDQWAIARRAAGLPALGGAIGRRGGMARDLDAQTTARLKSVVRGVADALAGRVDRLRNLGNGVDPVAGCDAFVHLSALLAEERKRSAGQFVLTETAE